jgi:class 3 adenylate cyclase
LAGRDVCAALVKAQYSVLALDPMEVLAEHNRLIRGQLDRFRGRELNTTGDGFLARFGSAAGAIRSAVAMRDGYEAWGSSSGSGVHTGEVEVLPNDIGGVAVHVASRIMALGPETACLRIGGRVFATGRNEPASKR